MSDEKYSPKNKYFFPSFNNDRELSLDDKTKDCGNKITVGLVHSLHHTNRVIFTEKFAYLSGRTKKIKFSKIKIIFYKKTTPQLLEHIGLQNMKVGEKTNLGDLPLFV